MDEEVGMKGAAGIDLSGLKSRLLLNLDSETEGEITAGCAGAARVDIAVPVKRDTFPGETVEITVSGLLGGHSGAAIDRGRANAMVLLGRILYAFLQENDGRLVTLSGGGKDNAIPVSASAVLTVADAEKTTVICQKMEKIFRREYAVADSDIAVTVAPCRSDVLPMDADSTHRVLALLQCAPNGVLERSREVEGLVQTSLNLGILATEADSVVATFCVRSNMNTQKEMLLQKLELLCDLLGGKISVSGSYPAWEFREDSPLRALIVEVFTEQYGHAPKIEVLHGGVECGMLADKLPGLDAVAMGAGGEPDPYTSGADVYFLRPAYLEPGCGDPPPAAVRNSKSILEAESFVLSASLFVPGGGAATRHEPCPARTFGEPTPDELSRPLRKESGLPGRCAHWSGTYNVC